MICRITARKPRGGGARRAALPSTRRPRHRAHCQLSRLYLGRHPRMGAASSSGQSAAPAAAREMSLTARVPGGRGVHPLSSNNPNSRRQEEPERSVRGPACCLYTRSSTVACVYEKEEGQRKRESERDRHRESALDAGLLPLCWCWN